jgi:cyclopropane fatty-acyl-phospholipid synthase-like methyltransferase
VYAEQPRWDIGRPQPAVKRLVQAGAFGHRVLDIGCGTGEHVLLCAAAGLDATGVDIAEAPLAMARNKAAQRGLTARFLRHDVRQLADLGESFDTVLDCGLFHIFTGADREAYLAAIAAVTQPGSRLFLLCFHGPQPGTPDQQISARTIGRVFADGWRIDTIQAATLDSRTDPDGIAALLASLTRI